MSIYLITGGAGFIGSNFIRYLLEQEMNHQIVNVDCLTYAGKLENMKAFLENPHHFFIHENICTKDAIIGIFEKFRPDFVVNFAAESHVDRSIANSDLFVKTNVLGTHNLLEAACRITVQKYVQISTDEVYGSLGKHGLFTEASPLSPSNPYAASKAAADLMVQAFFQTHGLPMNITRCTNNYGPNQHWEKLIPLTIRHCLLQRRIPLYGDGKHVRDWIHVEDHCRAIYQVIHKGVSGEVYNIGANQEQENIEVVKLIIRDVLEVNKQKRWIGEEQIHFVEDRKSHDRRYGIDARKLREQLGWKPLYDFKEGLRQTIQWYVDHEDYLNGDDMEENR